MTMNVKQQEKFSAAFTLKGNDKMKKTILTAAAIALLFTGCNKAPAENTAETASETLSETAVTSAQTAAAQTDAKPLPALTPTKRQSYFENEDYSVCAELKKLQSSLYYPDIVAQMGANPEMFAVEISLKVKNISHEDKVFDSSELSLMSGENALYIFGAEQVEIGSGKTENLKVRVLCTLEQAADISGMSFEGESFEAAEEIVPESILEAIDVQSADDVREYLYKQYVIYQRSDYYRMSYSDPAAIVTHFLGRVGENNEYFAVEYQVTNRSDYALIIDPNSYQIALYGDDGSIYEPKNVYVSTDEELMYEPKSEGRINGVGKVYDVPEFICMKPDGCTKFTMLYNVPEHISKWLIRCDRHDENFYAQYECIIITECDY